MTETSPAARLAIAARRKDLACPLVLALLASLTFGCAGLPSYLLYDEESLVVFNRNYRTWGPFQTRSDLVRLTATIRHRNAEQLIVRASAPSTTCAPSRIQPPTKPSTPRYKNPSSSGRSPPHRRCRRQASPSHSSSNQ